MNLKINKKKAVLTNNKNKTMKYNISLIEHQTEQDIEDKLNNSYRNSLQEYLEKQKNNDLLQNVFNFTSKGIKANHYVGMLIYKNYQFTILPKLLNKENLSEKEKQDILKNLLYMLSLTKKLDIKESEIAKISKNKNPFLEILIKIYANSLFECLKRFVPKNYVTEEDNLNFLKGKLLFSKHIIKNSVNQSKFYCQYDEFSENNLLNQLFYYVSRLLYFASTDNENKKVLKFITDFFCDIDFKKINVYKIRNLKLTRNQTAFQKPFDLAKMFLENSLIDMNQHKIKTISLLWDMNKLFEEFVFEFIKRNKGEINKNITEIKAQKHNKLLVCKDDNREYGNTYVDIFLTINKETIILDTKYKLNNGDKKDFANADIFQMLAYETIHKTNKAVLIYPTIYNENININRYYFIEKKDKYIVTATIYLGKDLQKDKQNLITRLSEILQQTINIK